MAEILDSIKLTYRYDRMGVVWIMMPIMPLRRGGGAAPILGLEKAPESLGCIIGAGSLDKAY